MNIWIVRAKKVIYGSALVALLFLSIVSLIYSSDGYVLTVNSPLRICLSLIWGAILLVLCRGVVYCVEKLPRIWHVVGGMVLFVSAVSFSAWWIVNSANMPQSDAKAVYDIACRAKEHDLLPIAPTGSYMSLWPFQSGLVMFMETILRLIPNADEMTIQWMYLPFMALSLISGYMVVKKMFPSIMTRVIWCILMFLCFPYYFFINNMYGDVPGIALTLFTMWMLLEYTDKPVWVKLVFAGMGLAVAVAVRKNTMIFCIACILVFGVQLLVYRKKQYLFVILLVLVSSAAGAVLPGKVYEYRAKNTMGEGVPAIAYIAMGLQWSEGRSPGAWNGYHSDLFMECGYDSDLTAEISLESVEDSLEYMVKHPMYMTQFFYYKLVYQWAREDYGCLYATLDFYDNRTSAAWDIYQGKAKDRYIDIMAIHQSVVYIGAVGFCILGAVRWKKKEDYNIQNLIPLVAFIGGFLFSIIWEASSRAVMAYFVLIIPYAADGVAGVSSRVAERLRPAG